MEGDEFVLKIIQTYFTLKWLSKKQNFLLDVSDSYISFPCDNACSHAQRNSSHSGGFVKDIQSCPVVMCVGEKRAELCSFQRESIYLIDH